jgi:type IV pilus assembly protein PilZ
MLASSAVLQERQVRVELRRFNRSPIDQSLLFALKGSDEYVEGLGRDLSLGGMFIETSMPAPFGAEVIVHINLEGKELALPGVVRWTRGDGMGVQFRQMGARETHAITEIVRRQSEG